jgi:uncharacterized protein (DUF2252 family)
MDVVREITRFNAGRDVERLAIKYRRMRADAFVFLRATNHLFCERLRRAGPLPKSPSTWACGDLHLENFGTYKGDNGLVYFDLNDFDEAALAPAAWDAVRMLASIFVGAGSMQATHAEALALSRSFLDAYALALADGKALRIERDTTQGPVRQLFDSLQARTRVEFLDARTELKGRRRRLRLDGKRALPASKEQQQHATAIVDAFAATQETPRFYEVLDVARRIAGSGSLGVERYVILVHGKGSPDQNRLLDLKQALPSAVTANLATRQPEWRSQAHRVVAVQQRMQAVAMAFLHPIKRGKRSFVLRALQPSEDRVWLDRSRQSLGQLDSVLRNMGQALAWAQLRSGGRDGSAIADALIDWGGRMRWRKDLLALAQGCATQASADWRTYAMAYDAGLFAT